MMVLPALPEAPPAPPPAAAKSPNSSAKPDQAEAASSDSKDSAKSTGPKPKPRKQGFADILLALNGTPTPIATPVTATAILGSTLTPGTGTATGQVAGAIAPTDAPVVSTASIATAATQDISQVAAVSQGSPPPSAADLLSKVAMQSPTAPIAPLTPTVVADASKSNVMLAATEIADAPSDTTSDAPSIAAGPSPIPGLVETTSWMSLRRIEASVDSRSTDGESRSRDESSGTPPTMIPFDVAFPASTGAATSAGAASSAATKSAPTADGIAEAIRGRLEDVKANGRIDLHLQLDPPELGRVRIQVTATDRQMTLKMVVQDDAARQAIQTQADALRDRLGSLGMTLGHLDVRQDGGGSANPRQPADQSPFQSADRSSWSGRTKPTASRGAQAPTRQQAGAGVDVIV